MSGESRGDQRLAAPGANKRTDPARTGTRPLSLRVRTRRRSGPVNSRLVALRHHKSLWLAPAVLLAGALLPWPYGYYDLLRLAVCAVSGWIAYEQWRHDDAVSGWVVAFGGMAMLYNPVMPIHLTREIWSVVNLASASLFVWHLSALTRLVRDTDSTARKKSRSRRLPKLSVSRWLPKRPKH